MTTTDEQALVVPNNGLPVGRDTRSPKQIIADAQERATAVADIIRNRRLFKKIGTKEYVMVEGWVTLAAQYNLVPSIAWCRKAEHGGWEAQAELRRMDTGIVVATAEAEAGTEGDGDWQKRASYAQRSMAETRAVSKVCRVALSWVIVLAGYQATPAEEVPDGGFQDGPQSRSRAPQRPPSPAPQRTMPDQRPAPPARDEGTQRTGPDPNAAGKDITTSQMNYIRKKLSDLFGKDEQRQCEFLDTTVPLDTPRTEVHLSGLTKQQASTIINAMSNSTLGMAP